MTLTISALRYTARFGSLNPKKTAEHRTLVILRQALRKPLEQRGTRQMPGHYSVRPGQGISPIKFDTVQSPRTEDKRYGTVYILVAPRNKRQEQIEIDFQPADDQPRVTYRTFMAEDERIRQKIGEARALRAKRETPVTEDTVIGLAQQLLDRIQEAGGFTTFANLPPENLQFMCEVFGIPMAPVQQYPGMVRQQFPYRPQV